MSRRIQSRRTSRQGIRLLQVRARRNPRRPTLAASRHRHSAARLIGLPLLEAEDELLPAAFYWVFVANLYKWMRVYEYVDAREHAETWMEDLDDEELQASVYRKVEMEIPSCIRKHAPRMKHKRARRLLQEIKPAAPLTRQLIRHVLEMDAHGLGHEHA